MEENLKRLAGGHDDIFASDSDDEGQPQGRVGNASEAEDEDEEDEFEAMFQPGKKRKREKGRTQEVGRFPSTKLTGVCISLTPPPLS